VEETLVTQDRDRNGHDPQETVFWRVEGSLLNIDALRPVAYFTWNSQSFSERWKRRGGLFLLALLRPILYATDRIFATRVLHTLLRGVSRDRLDLIGEEYVNYVLTPTLHPAAVERLRELQKQGKTVVLVSQALDHIMRPLAQHLNVERILCNRLEFRDGFATGRLLTPVIRPRQFLARIATRHVDGQIPFSRLAAKLGFADEPELLRAAIESIGERPTRTRGPLVLFDDGPQATQSLSVVDGLRGRNILLIGVTGFIGKVWLAKVLRDLPEVGKIFLLIRDQRLTGSQRRFEKIVEESPVFDQLHEALGEGEFLRRLHEKIEVVSGDITLPGLGLSQENQVMLGSELDLVINSAGLTDFNPDLRQAISINIDGTVNLLDFLGKCQKASLLHLSTCYVVGFRDGRIAEELSRDYNPLGQPDFDAIREYENLKEIVRNVELKAESEEMTARLRKDVIERTKKSLSDTELEAHLRKARSRWVRGEVTEAGMQRAVELGWPNTYTLTKSIAESIIAERGADLPIAVVRPSIVETSTRDPFCGWNEGVNTSAPLSYLLGTFFRQLPSNARKCLDIIPVDLVCRGMILVAAALVQRRHARMYQLATSATNPCNMGRSIELTGLAHRKHYRAQNDFEYRLLSMFDSIPVSKERYQKLSAPRQKAVVQALRRITAPLPMARSPLVRRERDLDRVEKLIQLYEPFILHNVYVFEAKNVEYLSVQLPADEVERFGYDATSIDWWEYWINIHIPALRKWSYPIIEGRPTETRASRSFTLESASGRVAVASKASRLADDKIGN
jgi:thioester reductase-like protein